MKNLSIIALPLLCILGCKKDCQEICEHPELICVVDPFILDSSSIDLNHYVIRNDSSSLYGIGIAIKHVPETGAIAWIGNNGVSKLYGENYFLTMANYQDTAWYDLEYWAFLREVVNVKFDPFNNCKQKIFDEDTYNQDTTTSYAVFYMNADDFRLAKWKIDKEKDNHIIVTEFDKSNDVVEGRFELYFTKEIDNSPPSIGNFAENVEFRCGKFKAKIFEY